MENDANIEDDNKNMNLQDDEIFDQFIKNAYQNIAAATSASNAFPQDQAWDLHAAHPTFVSAMSEMEQMTMNILSRVLKQQRVKGNLQERDIDEKYDLLLEANDGLVDKINSHLDELSGVRKNLPPVLVESSISSNEVTKTVSTPGSWNKNSTPTRNNAAKIRLLSAHNIQRPQLMFKDKIDNSNSSPFIPKLTDKPNSRKPLALEATEDGYAHPYDFELENFQPTEEQLTCIKPIEPLPMEKTPLIYVDDEKSLNSLLRDLLVEKVFAVDVEHHSYRTFQGITCLLQISTRKCDYIIDTLVLRDKLEMLNEAFTKPDIVKVFHGAECDIQWLQRDLGIYVVNMFDTYQASKQLGYPRLSLAFVLEHYCKIDVNKHFQLADWRIRPLPDELLLYARSDTHYLLYIYDKMRNELIDMGNGKSNILQNVISKSTDICKIVYVKPKLKDDSYLKYYIKCKKMFDNRQLFALQKIYEWRDNIARENDESTLYVLPNHMLLQICEALPREMQGIFACCNPVPPLVRQNLINLHQIVLNARAQPLVKPILKEELRTRGPEHKSEISVDGPLHCPHDLSQGLEFRDDLPTLLGDLDNFNMGKCFAHNILGQQKIFSKSKDLIISKPKLSIFDSPEHAERQDLNLVSKLQKIAFVSPYERYKLVRPFTDSIEKEAITNSNEETANVDTIENNTLSEKDKESIARVKDHFATLIRNPASSNGKVNAFTSTPTTSKDTESTSATTTSFNQTEIDTETPLRLKKKRKRDNSETPSSSNSKHFNRSCNEEDNQASSSNINQQVSNKILNAGEFRAFDYSSIDFRKYQGGSQQRSTTDQVKTKFNGKAKNKFNGYRNNKSYTYGKNKNGKNRNQSWKS